MRYDLDMIIAIGYRVQSQIATRFRQWATELDSFFGQANCRIAKKAAAR